MEYRDIASHLLGFAAMFSIATRLFYGVKLLALHPSGFEFKIPPSPSLVLNQNDRLQSVLLFQLLAGVGEELDL